MSVRIFPCHGCPIGNGCDHRKVLAARVAGLGLRSAAFPCERLAAELRPGRRVVISQPYLSEGSDYYGEPVREVFRLNVSATISGVQRHYRPSVIVDGGRPFPADAIETEDQLNKARFRRAMPHTRIIRFLDEPDRPLCKLGRVLLPSGECDRLDWPDDNGPCRCKSLAEIETLAQAGAQ